MNIFSFFIKKFKKSKYSDKVLFIIRGLPGSGKSTLAETILNMNGRLNTTICTADDYFYKNGKYEFDKTKLSEAHNQCYIKALNAIKAGVKCVIVANTNTTEKEFLKYIELAKDYDYKVFSIIVENRHNNKSIHNVPEETIKEMANRFQIKL